MTTGVIIAVALWIAGPLLFLLWLDRTEARMDAEVAADLERHVQEAIAVAEASRDFDKWEAQVSP